ncbi:hypothetical protein [Pseudoduganella violaceinigra]|uniref:hypothetical protein n=1 Tax=Pseudoduganella violaceinigra TaxID=246602 RepID=UPI0004118701|nr:hypothetical protein [Pseudoduganella violaceinigra]
MNRPSFISAPAAGAASAILPAQAATPRIKAVAFDGLALFDPRPIFALGEQFLPGRGTALATDAPAEQLGVAPDAVAASFDALPAFVGA